MVRVSLVIRYIGKIFSVAEVIFRVFLAECSAAEAPNAQHADWLNATLPRNYVTDRPILLEHKCGHTTFVLGGFSRNGHTTFVLGDFFRNGHRTFVSCKIRHEKTYFMTKSNCALKPYAIVYKNS